MASKKTVVVGPDYEKMSRQLRRDFYEREKAPGRQQVHARFVALGVGVGAHKKGKKEG